MNNDCKILNCFKPVGVTSYDVIREIKHLFKRSKQQFKIGHFGTLDPFASGVLLVGLDRATKFNDLIHLYSPKTYLAIGKLGVSSETGDNTAPIAKKDDSDYLQRVIKNFDTSFLETRIQEKFLGDYWQVPHVFSATKYMGKALHQWAREDNIHIQKDPVLRHIYKIEVVKYSFPYLSIRVTASSGTYIRKLFEDIAFDFGTFGLLLGLVRESIGKANIFSEHNIKMKQIKVLQNSEQLLENALDVRSLFDFKDIILNPNSFKLFSNGGKISFENCTFIDGQSISTLEAPYRWVYLFENGEKKLLSLAKIDQTARFFQSHIQL